MLQDSQPDTALLNYEELANLATGQGRPEIARDLYSRACQLYAPTSRFLRMWGLFEKRQGNVERARSLFRESLDCDAMDIKTWTMWGVLERTQGDHETALHMFREVRLGGLVVPVTIAVYLSQLLTVPAKCDVYGERDGMTASSAATRLSSLSMGGGMQGGPGSVEHLSSAVTVLLSLT